MRKYLLDLFRKNDKKKIVLPWDIVCTNLTEMIKRFFFCFKRPETAKSIFNKLYHFINAEYNDVKIPMSS